MVDVLSPLGVIYWIGGCLRSGMRGDLMGMLTMRRRILCRRSGRGGVGVDDSWDLGQVAMVMQALTVSSDNDQKTIACIRSKEDYRYEQSLAT